MRYVLLFKSKVVQISGKTFPVADPLHWLETDIADIEIGYVYDGEVFNPPPPVKPPPDDKFTKAIKLVISAIAKYIAGSITKADLINLYQSHKDTIESINE